MARPSKKPQVAPAPPEEPPEDLADQLDLTTDPLFLQFVEAHGGGDLDPLSPEAVALQARYVREVGDHPLDVLKTLVRNPFVKPAERISAAKALLEYGARKVPASVEVGGPQGAPLSGLRLSALSDQELGALTALIKKAGGA